jgi:FdhD protein
MRLPKQSIEITEVLEWAKGKLHRVTDYLAAEEPLEIRVARQEEPPAALTVTMRTPGNDLELAAGFLLTEGILSSSEELLAIRAVSNESTGKSNVVEVQIAGKEYDPEQMRRNFFAASSCGLPLKRSGRVACVGPIPLFGFLPRYSLRSTGSCEKIKRCSRRREVCTRPGCLQRPEN